MTWTVSTIIILKNVLRNLKKNWKNVKINNLPNGENKVVQRCQISLNFFYVAEKISQAYQNNFKISMIDTSNHPKTNG